MADNKIDDWEEVAIDDWEEVAVDDWQEVDSQPSSLEAFGHNFTNFFGLQDEIEGGLEAAGRAAGIEGLGGPVDEIGLSEDGPTLDRDVLLESYRNRRDVRRAYMDALKAAQPTASMAGQITGDIATGLTGGAVLGAASKGTGAAANVASKVNSLSMPSKAAIGGAGYGFGESEADSVQDLAIDTGVGAATGLVTGGAMKAAGKGLSKAGKALADSKTLKSAGDSMRRGASKVGSLVSGVDEDALMRQALRAKETAAAEADDFVYDLAKQAQGEVLSNKAYFGQKVGEAGNDFLKTQGRRSFRTQAQEIAQQIDSFLKRNKPSKSGFSALTEKQSGELKALSEKLRGKVSGEDMFKLREYVDNVKNVAKKYDVDETGPFINFLKNIRHQADTAVDSASPKLDSANRAFSNFIEDSKLLNINKDNTAESVLGNLYGLNKTAKKKAAERILAPSTLESVKDVAANKAFGAAARPGGDNYFRRGALAAITMGASELGTNPNVWKRGMRLMRPGVIQRMGKFTKPLGDAAQRGENALAATHFLLYQNNADYRTQFNGVNGEEDDVE